MKQYFRAYTTLSVVVRVRKAAVNWRSGVPTRLVHVLRVLSLHSYGRPVVQLFRSLRSIWACSPSLIASQTPILRRPV